MPRTRNQTRQSLQSTHANLKRQAIENPDGGPQRKRSAFGDLTNAISNNLVIDSSKKKSCLIPVAKNSNKQQGAPAKKKQQNRSRGGRGSFTKTKDDLGAIPEELFVEEAPKPKRTSRSRSGSAGATDQSGICTSEPSSAEVTVALPAGQNSSSSSDSEIEYHKPGHADLNEPPTPPLNAHPDSQGVSHGIDVNQEEDNSGDDFDNENISDPFNVPHYARDIFEYYRTRENQFKVGDYLLRQPSLSRNMRAILIDWMVEIQENFELNHETLYQAVKITDLYLDRETVSKENLQLIGSTALFIACKFDERCPPCCDDFLYICDDAYTKEQLFECERKVLKTLEFDIGMPMSYRFVRRYAKTSKVGMETLTLARYILETSLLFYEFVGESDSKIASAAFLLALRMKKVGDWGDVQEKYSGYKLDQIEPLMWKLNEMLTSPLPGKNTKTVLNKYNHEVFFEVAKTAPLVPGAHGKDQKGRA